MIKNPINQHSLPIYRMEFLTISVNEWVINKC